MESPLVVSPPGPGIEGLFDAVADDYDQSGMAFFQPMAEALVARLAPRPGEQALDIGCGRGAVTTRLVDAVGGGGPGSVVAIDLSARMVEHVRALVPEADVRRMDAAEPDLPEGSFDVVAASAVLFFLQEPRAVVRRWLRLLKPGGRLGLTTFGPVDPVWRQADEVVEAWRPPGLPDPRVAMKEGPFGDTERFDTMLREAGALEVESRVEPLEVRLRSAEEWLRFSLATGQRRAWAAIPEARLAETVDTVRGILESARDDSGTLRLSQKIRYTTARA